jgi:hypothetical protein
VGDYPHNENGKEHDHSNFAVVHGLASHEKFRFLLTIRRLPDRLGWWHVWQMVPTATAIGPDDGDNLLGRITAGDHVAFQTHFDPGPHDPRKVPDKNPGEAEYQGHRYNGDENFFFAHDRVSTGVFF